MWLAHQDTSFTHQDTWASLQQQYHNYLTEQYIVFMQLCCREKNWDTIRFILKLTSSNSYDEIWQCILTTGLFQNNTRKWKPWTMPLSHSKDNERDRETERDCVCTYTHTHTRKRLDTDKRSTKTAIGVLLPNIQWKCHLKMLNHTPNHESKTLVRKL